MKIYGLSGIEVPEELLHSSQRICSFQISSKKYWIKNFAVRECRDIFKPGTKQAIDREVTMLERFAQAGFSVPEIVGRTDRQLILTDVGPTLNILLPTASRFLRMKLLILAAEELARLHQKGLFHGRPALRDIACDGRRISFLDFENATAFRPWLTPQERDIFYFISSMYRESYLDDQDAKLVLSVYQRHNKSMRAIVLHLKKTLDKWRVFERFVEKFPFHGKDILAVHRIFHLFGDKAGL